MTEPTATELREHYLRALEAALTDLPHGIAVELRDGIAEELDGLDVGETAARISALGDPRVVARAAADSMAAGASVNPATITPERSDARPSAPPRKPYLADTKGFAIAGAIILGFGNFLIPFAAWVVGASLVTSSRYWYRWEKTVAVLAPVAVAALGFLLTLAGGRLLWWSILVLAGIAVPLSGAWLLWLLRERDQPVTQSRLDRMIAEQDGGGEERNRD